MLMILNNIFDLNKCEWMNSPIRCYSEGHL